MSRPTVLVYDDSQGCSPIAATLGDRGLNLVLLPIQEVPAEMMPADRLLGALDPCLIVWDYHGLLGACAARLEQVYKLPSAEEVPFIVLSDQVGPDACALFRDGAVEVLPRSRPDLLALLVRQLTIANVCGEAGVGGSRIDSGPTSSHEPVLDHVQAR